METFSALLALCGGNSLVTGEFPSQRPVTQSRLMFPLIWDWINGWVNNREAGDLRRHRTQYDATVMPYMWHLAKISVGKSFSSDVQCVSCRSNLVQTTSEEVFILSPWLLSCSIPITKESYAVQCLFLYTKDLNTHWHTIFWICL